MPSNKIKTLYNPFDIELIEEKAKEKVDFEILSPTIVSVGRMDKVKGYRHLLRSLKIAMKSIPTLKLVLVGDGDELDSLIQFSKDIEVFDNVVFTNFQSNPSSYVAKCDIYVVSSINEGFPNALVEAMANGIPIISVDCKTGPREILSSDLINETARYIEYADYGVLVPPFISDYSNEPEKDKLLAKAIVEMINDKDLHKKYRKHSKERAKKFSLESYRKRIIEIIEQSN